MKGVLLLVLPALSFFACSFDYENIDSSKTPDMVLTGVVAERHSGGKKTFEITAAIMEIYSSEKIWAADTVSFREFSDEGSEENSASAGIMLLDEKNEVYTLGGTVTFYAGEDNLTIRGEDLRWNKRENFISAPVESKVEITGENIAASGSGFSANTQERSYSFSGRITGMLIPKDGGEAIEE